MTDPTTVPGPLSRTSRATPKQHLNSLNTFPVRAVRLTTSNLQGEC